MKHAVTALAIASLFSVSALSTASANDYKMVYINPTMGVAEDGNLTRN